MAIWHNIGDFIFKKQENGGPPKFLFQIYLIFRNGFLEIKIARNWKTNLRGVIEAEILNWDLKQANWTDGFLPNLLTRFKNFVLR